MQIITITTPLGPLFIEASDSHLHSIRFCTYNPQKNSNISTINTPLLKETSRQINAYFLGQLKKFDLPLKLSGTLFQRQVKQQLLKLPYGTTVSYKTLATSINKPQASRAVGAACKNNPLLIVIPCHRVISSSGKLTGFAAGIDRKQELIAMEAKSIHHIGLSGGEVYRTPPKIETPIRRR